MINVYDFLKYQPELYKQFTCKDMLFAYYDCPQITSRADIYSHHTIFAFDIRGRKIFHRAEKSWIFEPGAGILIKKGGFIQEVYFEEGYRSISIYVSDARLLQLINAYQKSKNRKTLPIQHTEPIIELDLSEITKQLLETILSFFSQQSPPSEEILGRVFYDLVFSLLDNTANQSLTSYLNSIAEQPKTSLFEIMEANYMYNLSLSDYARISNRSLATFKRDFKLLFNAPPAKWLMEKRLEYARSLLHITQKSIGEVSFESGFENNAHFSRTFKEKFGLPPLQYRREQIPPAYI
jgi:AraC-like DNA-binding protein